MKIQQVVVYTPFGEYLSYTVGVEGVTEIAANENRVWIIKGKKTTRMFYGLPYQIIY